MKLESETLVEINPDFSPTGEKFTPNEEKIFFQLGNKKECTVASIEKETGIKNALPAINALLAKEAIFVKEEVKRTYKPKVEVRVRLRLQEIRSIESRSTDDSFRSAGVQECRSADNSSDYEGSMQYCHPEQCEGSVNVNIIVFCWRDQILHSVNFVQDDRDGITIVCTSALQKVLMKEPLSALLTLQIIISSTQDNLFSCDTPSSTSL